MLCDEYGIKIEFYNTALLLIFTHIDLLGRLYAGNTSERNKSKHAVEFMRKYLGRINDKYAKMVGLLYHTLRNGYVHLGTPKRIKLSCSEYLDFSFTSKHKIDEHFSIRKSKDGGEIVHRILIHITQLYEDLMSAYELFANDIINVQLLSDKFKRSFELRRLGDTEEELLEKNKWLEVDFRYIHSEIFPQKS